MHIYSQTQRYILFRFVVGLAIAKQMYSFLFFLPPNSSTILSVSDTYNVATTTIGHNPFFVLVVRSDVRTHSPYRQTHRCQWVSNFKLHSIRKCVRAGPPIRSATIYHINRIVAAVLENWLTDRIYTIEFVGQILFCLPTGISSHECVALVTFNRPSYG